MMNKILFALSIVFSSFFVFSQGGVNCSGMAPICTDVGLNFTANADGQEASLTDPGNNYDCLFSQPNPTWYYFQIATDGNIEMELAAASDIDFAIWGPFTSLSVAQAACGSLGNQVPPNPNNGNLVDCSFSINATENPVIPTAITGEVYVMLITNFAGIVQNITLTQTGGTGSTDCDIVTNPPCSISALNTSISGCDFITNSYEITGTVDVTSPPASGDLVLEDCDGNTTTIASSPFNATSYAYTLSGLSANGSACTLQAYFTSETTCSQTVNYVAPACISNCPSYDLQSSSATETCGNQTYWLEIENSGCNGFLSFDVVGNYGSLWANEISWTVTSNTSGNIVAQGGPGSDGGAINVSVGPLDPSVEGDLYTLEVVDVFGDGFNGTGGFIEIQQNGSVLTNSITIFTTSSVVIVQPSVDVSSSTLTVNTPSGTITNVTSNCLDHEVGIMLANTNFCTPIVVDLPWSIICDVTGGLISSGTQTVTVYPQVPSSASDLVSITWNTSTCSWDVSPNNDCSELDIGSIFTITPDVSSLGPYCSNGSENFSVSYTGFSGGLNCCSTSGPEIPIEYTENQTVTNAVVASSPFGGINNSAYFVIPANGSGGNATDLAFDFSMTGYCFDPADTETDDSYWVTIYVDGFAIYDVQHFDPPGSMSQSFTLTDMPNGYNENSIIEVYVYPNSFGLLDGSIMTTYVPNGSCPNPGDANWTCSSAIVSFSTTYEQTAPSGINCEFPLEAPYTCCTTSSLSAEGPAPVNVQCISELPVSDIGSITNIVSDCPVVVAFVSDASDGNTCPETITRTYSVTDDCANSINVTQTITVNDITPPVFSTPPANITVECVDDVPAMIDLSWTDNCDGTGAVTGVDGPILGPPSCGGTFTRTWTYMDACGNVATETQDITVFDTTPPVFATPPANITVECVGDVPAMIDLSWTDNCDGTGTVTGVDGAIIGGSCGGTITRTWTYMDACENVVTATQVITVDDTTPPSASNPEGISVECVDDVPLADISVVTDAADNCTAIPTISFFSDNSDGNTCPEIITRTYSVADDCGNEIMVTQTITVNDITPPTASNLAGVNVECVDDIPVADIAVVTDAADNCTAVPTVSFVSDAYTAIDGYSVNDDLSWISSTSNLFESPDFDFCNNPVNYSISTQPSSASPVPGTTMIIIPVDMAIDNSTQIDVDIIFNQPVQNLRVYVNDIDQNVDPTNGNNLEESLSDLTVNGLPTVPNVIPVTGIIQWDAINQIISSVGNNTTGWIEIPGSVETFAFTYNRLGAGYGVQIDSIQFDCIEENTSLPECSEFVTRTYSVTDDCGNSTNVTQTITVSDITPPTASNPPNIDIPIAPAPDPDITVITDATDNCTPSPIVAFVSDQSDGGDCPEVITRIYSVTDDCGNETLVTQLIVIGGGLVPAPTVTANGPICEGEDAVFTIDGLVDAVVTYDVGAGPETLTLLGGTGDVTVPSVNSDVTITISNIADGSCSSIIDLSATTVVNLLSLPTFTSFGPYCQNETPDALPALSIEGYTGIWNPPNIDPSISGIGIYTFTPDAGQCAAETIIEVEITEPTVPIFTQIDDICEGTEVFAGGSPFPVASDNGIIGVWSPVFDAFNTTTYTFTPDPAICATTTTMTITIVGFPDVDAGEDQVITCNNNVDGAQIGAVEVPGNVYSWSPTTGLSDPNIANPIASPGVSTTYTLTVTNSTGCSAEGTVNVLVDDTPPVVAITNNTGSTTLTCTQLEISVTASGADTYTWDNGLGNSTSPIITSPGVYTVTGTGINGCESTAEIEVIQDTGVDLLLALAQPEICSGDVVDISMNSSNATDFNWTVIQNGATGATNGTAPNTGFGASVSQVLTVTGTGNGTVDYAVEPILGGCVGTAQIVTVTVLAPETPQFNQLGPFCINDVATALSPSSLEGIMGTWSPSSVSTTSAGTSTYSFTPNSGQCAATQTMDIVVNELPTVSFSGDSLVGCAPHTVVLTSESSSSTWTVSNGVTMDGNEVTLVLTNPGCYDVTLQVDENGCTNSLTMPNYICIEQDPIADFTASPDLFTDDDALVSFTNLSSGASSFIWDFGDGNTSSYINPSNLYENTEEGALITLTAISDFGCMDEAQLIIEYDEQEIFYIPNTFTPDGDNFNQIFTPVFYSGFDPYNFEMLIFNRWGEIVFESHNAEIGWDGSYGVKGIKAMDGTYSWKITYKNPKTDERKVIVGHVTLMR